VTAKSPAPPIAQESSAALISDDVLRKFLGAAVAECRHITPDEPRPCFGAQHGGFYYSLAAGDPDCVSLSLRMNAPAGKEYL
jgi:hypothetical protein